MLFLLVLTLKDSLFSVCVCCCFSVWAQSCPAGEQLVWEELSGKLYTEREQVQPWGRTGPMCESQWTHSRERSSSHQHSRSASSKHLRGEIKGTCEQLCEALWSWTSCVPAGSTAWRLHWASKNETLQSPELLQWSFLWSFTGSDITTQREASGFMA